MKGGAVAVNGAVVKAPWTLVRLGDRISVRGGPAFAVKPPPPPVLWAVHKLPAEVTARRVALERLGSWLRV